MFAGTTDAAAQAQTSSPLKVEKAPPATDNAEVEVGVEAAPTEEAVGLHESAIREVFQFILEQIENPVDTWAIAATLESRGMRDIDAVEKCGKADIFDLADEIYRRGRRHLRTEELVSILLRQVDTRVDPPEILAILQARGLTDREAVENFGQPDLAALVGEINRRCQARISRAKSDPSLKDVPRSWRTRLGHFIQHRLSTSHTLVYTASFLLLVCTLWIYLYVAQVQAAVLGVGTIFSLLITGGFAKAMDHLSHAFTLQDSPILARAACSRLIRRGQLAAFFAGLIMVLASYLVGLLVPSLPIRAILIGLIDYFLLTMFWLFLAALAVVHRRRAVVQMMGSFTATLLLLLLTPNLYGLHWLGLMVTNGIAFWWWLRLPKLEPNEINREQKRVKLPDVSFFSFVRSPYLALAAFYAIYLLIFLIETFFGQATLPVWPWLSVFGVSSLLSWVPVGLMALLCITLTILFLEAALYEQKPPLAKDGPERLGRFARFYVRGISFAVPMAIQVVSVLGFGFGLWASLDFNEEAATTVAIGTILSFLVTSGFVQTIGRLGLFYKEQQSYLLAREISYRLIRSALLTVIMVGAGWYLLNLFIPLFPQRVILISLAYYFMLASLWLLLAVLYTLQQRLAIVIITMMGLAVIGLVLNWVKPEIYAVIDSWAPWLVMGIVGWIPISTGFFVWLLNGINSLLAYIGFIDPYRGIPWDIYAAHWIGLGVTAVLAFVWGHRKLFESVHWLNRQTTGAVAKLKLAKLPRLAIVSYAVGPYFTYGLLYFGYLFMDRLIGWSAGQEPLPLFIWFRTPYELGLDWALLSMLLTIAMLEYTVNEFGAIIVPEQERRKVIHVTAIDKSKKADTGTTASEPTDRQPGPPILRAGKAWLLRLWRPYGRRLRRQLAPPRQPRRKPLALDKKNVLPHPLNPDFEVVTTRQIKKHNDFFFRFYLRQLLLLTLIAIISGLVTYYGVLWFRRFDEVKAVRDFFASPITFAVFYWSVVGYSLLVWGLLNNVFFFFLSRPKFTIRALGVALIANLLIGFILSRMFVYWYSVIGMTLGTIFIAAITTYYAIRIFRRLDYYYYSAY